jgi:CheY-like chemotaxis protein
LSITSERSDNDDCVTLTISVSDTGQGMTKEQITSLFDEYSRFNTDSNRMTEGTGLGMSITRKLTLLMGGEISIDSEPGKGSTFTVRLPQKKVSDAVLGKDLANNLCNFRTNSSSRLRMIQPVREKMPYGSVLIVDDVETNIYVAKGLMYPYELKIESVDSGFEAIRKINDGNMYDIVFMDHMMPKMDGIEATKTIRNMGYKHPIVALTANAVAGQADIFLENGFDDFISKPIDIRQLNLILNKLVRDKHLSENTKVTRKEIDVIIEQTANDVQQSIDPQLAEICTRDALRSIEALDAICDKRGEYSDDDIRKFHVHVHGMKSVLANIGKKDLSDVASELEISVSKGNIEVKIPEIQAFISSLRALIDELVPKEEKACVVSTDKDCVYLNEKLLIIKLACEEYDICTADAAMKELREKSWSQQTKELLNVIAEYLLRSDFDELVGFVDKYLETK